MPTAHPRGATGPGGLAAVPVPQKETAAEKPARAAAGPRGRAHQHTTETNQPFIHLRSFNYDFSMRAIMHSCYYEGIHVSHLRGAHIYYINSILKNDLLTLSTLSQKYYCGIQGFSSCVSHLNLLIFLSSQM